MLRFVYGPLAKRLGRDLAPDVIAGTSIGALTGAWVGALGMAAAPTLSYFWREMLPEHVYQLRLRDLIARREALFSAPGDVTSTMALIDPSPFYEHVRQAVPWGALHARIDSGALKAFSCAVTDIASGRCIQFTDGHAQVRPERNIRQTATTTMRPARVRAEHVLASCAIPFVFPPVNVGGRWMVDGALRQNTPLGPALQLQCDRVLVIGVKRQREDNGVVSDASPTAATLAGRALNALMLDPVEEDLRRVERWNAMLTWAEGAYPGFGERMAKEHRAYRVVRSVHLRPSEDLGRIAAQIYPLVASELPLASRVFFEAIADKAEADLVSYFLFHKRYTSELEALGYADAEREAEAIAAVV